MRRAIVFGIMLLLVFPGAAPGVDDTLSGWERYARDGDHGTLADWIYNRARCITGNARCDPATPEPELPGRMGNCGLFVTLRRGSRVAGCFGAFFHEDARPLGLIDRYLEGALELDPRHEPLHPDQVDDTVIIVTVTSRPWPAENPADIDTGRYGVLIEGEGGAQEVYVPAEIRTRDHLSRQIRRLRAVSVSVFRAVTISLTNRQRVLQ